LLTLTFSGRDHPLAPPADLPIELFDVDDTALQARWLVHAAPAALEALRSLPSVAQLERRPASLEEIYIAYMRQRRPAGPDRPAAPAQVA
jgi:hypothetical protein